MGHPPAFWRGTFDCGGPPLELAIPLTLGASCAFMLPIATPPNAVVFSASYIRMSDMVRAGFWINVISVVFIVLYCLWAVPLFFG
ncbi:MAG: anion permease [Flavobacteriales bacterium]|nr:anion permease [Flavobacteriales bacterium]